MPDDDTQYGAAGTPAAHWGTRDSTGSSDRDQMVGLGRLVMEARARLGDTTTPEQVAKELRDRGLETTDDEVRAVWG